jgi:hypothetical protein
LLQAVSDRLVEEATARKTFVDKAVDFAKRVNLLKLGRIAAPVVTHVAVGTVAAGPLGALFGAVSGLVQDFAMRQAHRKPEGSPRCVRRALAGTRKRLAKKEASLPKEIERACGKLLRTSWRG